MSFFIEVIIALGAGIGIGIFTGLTPGIHVNLVSVLVVTSSPLLLQFTSPPILAVFIIALALTHTFLDTLPSIYLGAPDEAKVLSVLPGHRMLLQGQGHAAVIYTLIGSLGSVVLGVALFPFFIWSMEKLDPLISSWVGFILVGLVVYMIFREKGKRLQTTICFLLSGALGLLVLTSIPNLEQPLFPLLSGLFGVSLLIVSLSETSSIPEQNFTTPLTISTSAVAKSVSAASGMGFLAAFLPGFGSSQAATIATTMVRDIGEEGFLSLVGGINTANMLISIATIYALDKARNGAIVAVDDLLQIVTFEHMILFLGVALAAAGIGTILTLLLSRVFARLVVRVNYRALVLSIIVFITLLALVFDGVIGLLILVTATAIGLMAASWGIAKSHLLGCLLVPVILFFLL
ncbi:TPA: hypothetical protein HA241_03880 [Candidatus Woesearchaeota archaeon]|nr:hypothetical protein [Candidatus Woesearchaeota archaeon]